MGIRQYFVRITTQDLADLAQIEGDGSISQEDIDNDPEDETLLHDY